MSFLCPPLLGSPDSYQANAVTFDGVNDWLDATLSGLSDSKQVSGSLWVKLGATADGTSMSLIYGFQSSGNKFTYVYKISGNYIQLFGKNSSGTNVLSIRSPNNSILESDGWVHVLFSVDLSDTSKRFIYLNDVSQTLTVSTWVDSAIDFTLGSPGWFIGANGLEEARLDGDLAEVWYAPGVYLDLSDESVRRKFISSTGKPVNLGANGELPTGTSPLIYLKNPTATWQDNLGTGGNFSENGTLTTASTSPSD